MTMPNEGVGLLGEVASAPSLARSILRTGFRVKMLAR
jgi:hypothetical protein